MKTLRYPIETATETTVETTGTLVDTFSLNLWLRCGHRVLYFLDAFRAATPSKLYDRVYALPWETILETDGYVSVTSTIDAEAAADSRFVNVKTKDALVDRIRDKRGRRPNSGPERNAAVVHVYWKSGFARIFLDTSGEPLSRRGYRRNPLQAPLQETLAAGIVLSTGWNGEAPFVNPMCGSGTLAIEAALIGANRAPGLSRRNFGFMHLIGYDRIRWNEERRRARLREREIDSPIIATDLRQEAVDAARQNAAAAGVEEWIRFDACPFEKTTIPVGKGVVVVNPGYGIRLGEVDALKEQYRRLGDFFKQSCVGYRGYIFTGNAALAKSVGLKTSRRLTFFNSELECRLLEYTLYEGSRKGPSGMDNGEYHDPVTS